MGIFYDKIISNQNMSEFIFQKENTPICYKGNIFCEKSPFISNLQINDNNLLQLEQIKNSNSILEAETIEVKKTLFFKENLVVNKSLLLDKIDSSGGALNFKSEIKIENASLLSNEITTNNLSCRKINIKSTLSEKSSNVFINNKDLAFCCEFPNRTNGRYRSCKTTRLSHIFWDSYENDFLFNTGKFEKKVNIKLGQEGNKLCEKGGRPYIEWKDSGYQRYIEYETLGNETTYTIKHDANGDVRVWLNPNFPLQTSNFGKISRLGVLATGGGGAGGTSTSSGVFGDGGAGGNSGATVLCVLNTEPGNEFEIIIGRGQENVYDSNSGSVKDMRSSTIIRNKKDTTEYIEVESGYAGGIDGKVTQIQAGVKNNTKTNGIITYIKQHDGGYGWTQKVTVAEKLKENFNLELTRGEDNISVVQTSPLQESTKSCGGSGATSIWGPGGKGIIKGEANKGSPGAGGGGVGRNNYVASRASSGKALLFY